MTSFKPQRPAVYHYNRAPVIGNSCDGRALVERPNIKGEVELMNMDGLITSVAIDPIALEKMQYYVGFCSEEIGWLGTCQVYGSTALIDEVYLFDQEVSAATTELCEDDLAKFAQTFIADDPDSARDVLGRLQFWGHSHVRMPSNPSGTDDDTMEGLFKESGYDFAIRGIANKNGDLRIDIYNYSRGLAIQNAPWVIMKEHDQGLADETNSEMRDKVSRRTYTARYGVSAASKPVSNPHLYDNDIHNIYGDEILSDYESLMNDDGDY